MFVLLLPDNEQQSVRQERVCQLLSVRTHRAALSLHGLQNAELVSFSIID